MMKQLHMAVVLWDIPDEFRKSSGSWRLVNISESLLMQERFQLLSLEIHGQGIFMTDREHPF